MGRVGWVGWYCLQLLLDQLHNNNTEFHGVGWWVGWSKALCSHSNLSWGWVEVELGCDNTVQVDQTNSENLSQSRNPWWIGKHFNCKVWIQEGGNYSFCCGIKVLIPSSFVYSFATFRADITTGVLDYNTIIVMNKHVLKIWMNIVEKQLFRYSD